MYSLGYQPSAATASMTGPHIPRKHDPYANIFGGATPGFPTMTTALGWNAPILPPPVSNVANMNWLAAAPGHIKCSSLPCVNCVRVGIHPNVTNWALHCADCGTPAMASAHLAENWALNCSTCASAGVYPNLPRWHVHCATCGVPAVVSGSLGGTGSMTTLGNVSPNFGMSAYSPMSGVPFANVNPAWNRNVYGGYPSPYSLGSNYPGVMAGFPGAMMTGYPTTSPASLHGGYGGMIGFPTATATMDRTTGHPFGGNVFTSELALLPLRPSSHAEYHSMVNPIRVDPLGNRFFTCCFDMRGFRPEEVTVDFDHKNRCINIKATHDNKEDNFSIKRNYDRKYCIPEDLRVDVSKLDFKSHFSNDGVLFIEAVLPKLSLEEARSGIYPTATGYYPYTAGVFPIGVKSSGEPASRPSEPRR